MKKDRVVGIVVYEHKILLMYRINKGKKYYTLPGGGIETGETLKDAVKRELLEETSIVIKPGRFIYDVDWGDNNQHFLICKYIEGVPILGDYIEKQVMAKDSEQYYEPMWVEVEKLASFLLYPLEIRDWLIDDIVRGWPKITRHISLQLATCRQI